MRDGARTARTARKRGDMTTTRSRRAMVISLLCLTTFATSVHAECAWVLWSETIPEPADWRLLNAFGSEPTCRLALKKRIEANREAWSGNQGVEFGASENGFYVVRRNQARDIESSTLVNLYCLPDTVDPRGPKGK